MKLIAIVGHSGSGKTTLIEKLLPLLGAAGLRVATIKHTHHCVPLDTPGKDSWRFKQVGAVASLLVTPQAVQLVADLSAMHDPLSLARRYFGEVDLVLAESFSEAACDKIEVLRRACCKPPRCTVEDGLIALVTDMDEVHPQLPHFGLDALGGIADFILQQFPLPLGEG